MLTGPASLSTQIRSTVRERIISGHYPQGTRLPEARLAQELHVSRVPLREAMPHLELEGFVRTQPRRGALVRTWTLRDVQELFDVRLALEAAAARLAAQRVGGGAPTLSLDAALAHSQAALERADDLDIAATSVAFHEAVVATSGNALMASMMRGVSGRMRWLFHLTAQRDQHLACAEHHDLVAAVRAGDGGLAEAVAYAHIQRGRAPSLRALEELL